MSQILNTAQIGQLQKIVADELLKRGFPTSFDHFKERDGKIEFETKPFNTTPVIYRSIVVGNFSSSVKAVHPNGKSFVEVHIGINAHVESFSGGCNSVSLFHLEAVGPLNGGQIFLREIE